MVIRQTLPFSFGLEAGRRPSHLTVAVGLSIAVHLAIGSYVALMKFTGPEVAPFPEPPILTGPWVEKLPKPPPPTPSPAPERPQRPVTFNETVTADPPIAPLVTETTPRPPIDGGAIATLNPPPLTEADPPRDPIIRNPSWVRRPDAGDFARFYPERAMRLSRTGEAEITCSVTASGQLQACRVTGEAPDNMGFGQAALKLARYLQIAPKTIDGKPVDGGILVVPITFRLG